MTSLDSSTSQQNEEKVNAYYLLLPQVNIDFLSDLDRGVSGTVGKGGVHHITKDFAMKL